MNKDSITRMDSVIATLDCVIATLKECKVNSDECLKGNDDTCGIETSNFKDHTKDFLSISANAIETVIQDMIDSNSSTIAISELYIIAKGYRDRMVKA